ncbi:MAG: hypothetical protein ACLGI2_16550 [Acidimicrobiia bacterium]
MPDAQVTDVEVGDFRAGAPGPGVHIAAVSGGAELILAPTVAAEFCGDALPDKWFVEAWREGGKAEVNGRLTLEGATAGFAGMYGAGRSLEFAATFEKRPHQHVGFGTDFKNVPWITFSTKFGHSLYARSHFLIPEETRLSPSLLGSPHRFRIDWNVLDVDFWVDGRKIAYQLVPLVGMMRPLAGNGSQGGSPLAVEWVRMTPYAPEGTFVSRVHDAGAEARWEACVLDGDVPDDTSVSIEVRAGSTPEPGPSWSGWATLAGDARLPAGRYAQYRARLASANRSQTPVLRRVTLVASYSSSSSSSSS